MRKEQGIMYKNTTQKLKIEQYEPHEKNRGELRCSGMLGNFCSTHGTRRVNLVNLAASPVMTR
jgi:hypothetical protein